jgi:hypothetical protein
MQVWKGIKQMFCVVDLRLFNMIILTAKSDGMCHGHSATR